MIKLKEGLYVAADQVAEIQTRDSGDGLRVRMKDGSTHWLPNDYGKSQWTTQERLVAAVQAALQG